MSTPSNFASRPAQLTCTHFQCFVTSERQTTSQSHLAPSSALEPPPSPCSRTTSFFLLRNCGNPPPSSGFGTTSFFLFCSLPPPSCSGNCLLLLPARKLPKPTSTFLLWNHLPFLALEPAFSFILYWDLLPPSCSGTSLLLPALEPISSSGTHLLLPALEPAFSSFLHWGLPPPSCCGTCLLLHLALGSAASFLLWNLLSPPSCPGTCLLLHLALEPASSFLLWKCQNSPPYYCSGATYFLLTWNLPPPSGTGICLLLPALKTASSFFLLPALDPASSFLSWELPSSSCSEIAKTHLHVSALEPTPSSCSGTCLFFSALEPVFSFLL
ncbi:uncharacterized protein isoform X1 [Macaca fascicularis]|uniref:uncharacterized protein isoform X1 n=1 Tax=Macaca fascicularis TaxID=9541 RepID=UPI0032B03D0B